MLARTLFFMSGLFIFALLMLSFLPSNTWDVTGDSHPVYQSNEEYNDQLVSFLVSEQFALKIKKVEADTESLAVDFIVSESRLQKQTLYADLKKLIFAGFNQFASLEDIRARIIVRTAEKESLLIGVLARRDQYEHQSIKDNWKIDKVISFINDHFKVTYGPSWFE